MLSLPRCDRCGVVIAALLIAAVFYHTHHPMAIGTTTIVYEKPGTDSVDPSPNADTVELTGDTCGGEEGAAKEDV